MKNMTFLTCSLTMCALPLLFSGQVAAKQTVYQYKQVQAKTTPQTSISKTSQEYWQTYSGKELKAGIELSITDNEPLIRVAPKARFDNGQVFKPKGLELKQLKLVDKQTRKELKAQRKMSQQQMRDAGFDDGSIALASIGQSKNAILKTEQALNDSDKYLVHVIEKRSKHILKAKNQFKKAHKSDSLELELELNGKKPKKQQVQLRLNSSNDEQVNLEFDGNSVYFDQPLRELGARNGYYEIEALVTMDVNGEQLKRSIKMPFSNELQTASVGSESYQVANNRVDVSIPVTADMPGRYSIKATLAERQKGKLKKLATIEVARHVDHVETFDLPFQLSKKAKGKYTLVDLELTDQTRMIKMYPSQDNSDNVDDVTLPIRRR